MQTTNEEGRKVLALQTIFNFCCEHVISGHQIKVHVANKYIPKSRFLKMYEKITYYTSHNFIHEILSFRISTAILHKLPLKNVGSQNSQNMQFFAKIPI